MISLNEKTMRSHCIDNFSVSCNPSRMVVECKNCFEFVFTNNGYKLFCGIEIKLLFISSIFDKNSYSTLIVLGIELKAAWTVEKLPLPSCVTIILDWLFEPVKTQIVMINKITFFIIKFVSKRGIQRLPISNNALIQFLFPDSNSLNLKKYF
jgi:hypothetical protein